MLFILNKFLLTYLIFFSFFSTNLFLGILSLFHNYQNINNFINLFFSIPILSGDLESPYILAKNFELTNKNLMNSYSFLHPLILYIYLISFFKFSSFYLTIKKKNLFIYNISWLLMVTFVLASLWSAQELFWNGFWNWDFVELSLLNFVILFMSFQHYRFSKKYNIINIVLFAVFLLTFLITNKTNLIVSQHSFSSSFMFKLCYFYFVIYLFYNVKLVYLIINNNNFFFTTYMLIFFFSLFHVIVLKTNQSGLNINLNFTFFINFFLTMLLSKFSNPLSLINIWFFLLEFTVTVFTYIRYFSKNFFIKHLLYLYIFKFIFFFKLTYTYDFSCNSSLFVINQVILWNSVSVFNNLLNEFFIEDDRVNFFNFFFHKTGIFFLFKYNNILFSYFYNTPIFQMYLNKIKIQKQMKMFKKRKKLKLECDTSIFKIKPNKRFSNWSYIFTRFLTFLELKFYRFFFLKLRRLSRRKKFKSFVHVSCNHFFSKKSKNSRMGKGKGKFVRYVFRTKVLKPTFVFYKISHTRVIKFLKFLNKKSNNKFWQFFFC